jgi:hypothetical protein
MSLTAIEELKWEFEDCAIANLRRATSARYRRLRFNNRIEDKAERDWCETFRSATYEQFSPDRVLCTGPFVLDDSAWIWLLPTILITAHENWDRLELRDLGIWYNDDLIDESPVGRSRLDLMRENYSDAQLMAMCRVFSTMAFLSPILVRRAQLVDIVAQLLDDRIWCCESFEDQ